MTLSTDQIINELEASIAALNEIIDNIPSEEETEAVRLEIFDTIRELETGINNLSIIVTRITGRING